MCRATGAVFVRFEQLPEEARNFIEKCRNAALVADVGASCGGVGAFGCSAATVAFAVIV